MARPWQVLERSDTTDGALELRRRGERDFLVTLEGRVLMNSSASRSEVALAELACAELTGRRRPRVLIGGLGMGCTLRAALDALPGDARLTVAELHAVVERWCRGPLAEVSAHALADPRVQVKVADVASLIAQAPSMPGGRFDAILLDLFEGPGPSGRFDEHPQYGRKALERTRAALRDDGVLAIWCEDRAPAFEKALHRAGFAFRLERPGRGHRRHAVYLARGDRGRRRSPARER